MLIQFAQGKKILIVDDEELIREVCGAVLRLYGFEYILAKNGAEGLSLFRQRQAEICLVLSDVSMPQKNGIQLFRDILEIEPHANVILMSGYCMDLVVPEDLKKLCSVLQKPFTASQFITAIRKCLKHDQEHTQSTLPPLEWRESSTATREGFDARFLSGRRPR